MAAKPTTASAYTVQPLRSSNSSASSHKSQLASETECDSTLLAKVPQPASAAVTQPPPPPPVMAKPTAAGPTAHTRRAPLIPSADMDSENALPPMIRKQPKELPTVPAAAPAPAASAPALPAAAAAVVAAPPTKPMRTKAPVPPPPPSTAVTAKPAVTQPSVSSRGSSITSHESAPSEGSTTAMVDDYNPFATDMAHAASSKTTAPNAPAAAPNTGETHSPAAATSQDSISHSTTADSPPSKYTSGGSFRSHDDTMGYVDSVEMSMVTTPPRTRVSRSNTLVASSYHSNTLQAALADIRPRSPSLSDLDTCSRGPSRQASGNTRPVSMMATIHLDSASSRSASTECVHAAPAVASHSAVAAAAAAGEDTVPATGSPNTRRRPFYSASFVSPRRSKAQSTLSAAGQCEPPSPSGRPQPSKASVLFTPRHGAVLSPDSKYVCSPQFRGTTNIIAGRKAGNTLATDIERLQQYGSAATKMACMFNSEADRLEVLYTRTAVQASLAHLQAWAETTGKHSAFSTGSNGSVPANLRKLKVLKIALPLQWNSSVLRQIDSTSVFFFASVSCGDQVYSTRMLRAEGLSRVSELVFDEPLDFGNVAADFKLQVQVYAYNLVHRAEQEKQITTPKKALEAGLRMARKVKNATPKKLAQFKEFFADKFHEVRTHLHGQASADATAASHQASFMHVAPPLTPSKPQREELDDEKAEAIVSALPNFQLVATTSVDLVGAQGSRFPLAIVPNQACPLAKDIGVVVQLGPVQTVDKASYLTVLKEREWMRRWVVLRGGYLRVFEEGGAGANDEIGEPLVSNWERGQLEGESGGKAILL